MLTDQLDPNWEEAINHAKATSVGETTG